MKIKISDIEPNPYRDYDKDPIDPERIKGLVDSYKRGGDWGGIPVRVHPTKKGKYQIGCGHHRLFAMKKIGIEEIEAAVMDYSDIEMLRTMIVENAVHKPSPKKSRHEIGMAHEELSRILGLYDSWSEFNAARSCSVSFPTIKTAHGFSALKKQGVGRKTLREFIGPCVSDFLLTEVVAAIKASTGPDAYLSTEAVDLLPSTESMKVFRSAVKNYDIPEKTQIKIAKKIADEGIGRRDVEETVAEESLKPVVQTEKKEKPLPTLDKYTEETTKMMFNLMKRLDHLVDHIDNVLSFSVHNEFCLHIKDLIERLKFTEKELVNVQKENKKTIVGE